MKKLIGSYRLPLPALVIGSWRVKGSAKHSALVLPANSVVTVVPDGLDPHGPGTHPVGIRSDLPIWYADHTGGRHAGWIAASTSLDANALGPARFGDGDREPIGAWDDLREQLTLRGWTIQHFCSRLKKAELPLVGDAIRELGATRPKGNDTQAFAKQLIRLTASHQEVPPMSKSAKADAAPAKSAEGSKKVKTKKVKGEGRSAARSASAALLASGSSNGKIKAMAASLAAGDALSAKQLTAFRDTINDVAATARENGKDSIAARLSSCNRLIRRLARAAA
jgi:hypothetical protein